MCGLFFESIHLFLFFFYSTQPNKLINYFTSGNGYIGLFSIWNACRLLCNEMRREISFITSHHYLVDRMIFTNRSRYDKYQSEKYFFDNESRYTNKKERFGFEHKMILFNTSKINELTAIKKPLTISN